MSGWLPLAASEQAGKVDVIFFALLAIASAVILLVLSLIVGFAIRYRQGSDARRGKLPGALTREVEIGWTAATLFLFLFLFWWAGANLLSHYAPPKDALEIHVTAKQWMWRTQHPEGAREIDALHVPVGVPVRLIMTSQDVIHSFFVPAFRLKQDLVPGRLTQAWFRATRTGEYLLECAEYCGTDHSRMEGRVTVLSRKDYADWLASQPQTADLAAQGARLFVSAGCAGCHAGSSRVRAPDLYGLYGRRVPLEGGRFRLADEAYLRDSILQPRRDIVAGYQPVMPSFEGVLGEDDLVALTAYLKSLRSGDGRLP